VNDQELTNPSFPLKHDSRSIIIYHNNIPKIKNLLLSFITMRIGGFNYGEQLPLIRESASSQLATRGTTRQMSI
jgi:hypothetical protein